MVCSVSALAASHSGVGEPTRKFVDLPFFDVYEENRSNDHASIQLDEVD